jgi:hypothetical protein
VYQAHARPNAFAGQCPFCFVVMIRNNHLCCSNNGIALVFGRGSRDLQQAHKNTDRSDGDWLTKGTIDNQQLPYIETVLLGR